MNRILTGGEHIMSNHNKRLYRAGIIQLLLRRELDLELSVTLNFNRPTGILGVRKKLAEWAQRIDEYYLGRKWMERPDRRLFFIAFCENLNSNTHVHLL